MSSYKFLIVAEQQDVIRWIKSHVPGFLHAAVYSEFPPEEIVRGAIVAVHRHDFPLALAAQAEAVIVVYSNGRDTWTKVFRVFEETRFREKVEQLARTYVTDTGSTVEWLEPLPKQRN